MMFLYESAAEHLSHTSLYTTSLIHFQSHIKRVAGLSGPLPPSTVAAPSVPASAMTNGSEYAVIDLGGWKGMPRIWGVK